MEAAPRRVRAEIVERLGRRRRTAEDSARGERDPGSGGRARSPRSRRTPLDGVRRHVRPRRSLALRRPIRTAAIGSFMVPGGPAGRRRTARSARASRCRWSRSSAPVPRDSSRCDTSGSTRSVTASRCAAGSSASACSSCRQAPPRPAARRAGRAQSGLSSPSSAQTLARTLVDAAAPFRVGHRLRTTSSATASRPVACGRAASESRGLREGLTA